VVSEIKNVIEVVVEVGGTKEGSIESTQVHSQGQNQVNLLLHLHQMGLKK
jgi:hypothetical protein